MYKINSTILNLSVEDQASKHFRGNGFENFGNDYSGSLEVLP